MSNINQWSTFEMNRTLLSCILFGFLATCSGCTSSYEVSSSPLSDHSFDTFNAEVFGRSGNIIFRDNSELDGSDILAFQDSTRFTNEKTDVRAVVPTATIRKIVFTSHSSGLLQGLKWGVISGAAAGLLGAAVGYPFMKGGGEIPREVIFIFLPALGVGGGLIFGPIIGGIIGDTEEYRFEGGPTHQ
jgi:hypothetical protein